MNSRVIVIVIATVVVTGLLWWIHGKDNSTTPVDTSLTVVAFGDSLIAGVGAGPEENFVAILSQRLGVNIINSGVSGETTSGGLARLERDVLTHEPDVVLVLLGGNDALRNVPDDQVFANLSSIIDSIEASGGKVLLLGVRGGLLGGNFKSRFDRLAKDKDVEYVPDVLGGLFGDSRYMADSVHPNAAGYSRIADRIEPVLRRMLQSP